MGLGRTSSAHGHVYEKMERPKNSGVARCALAHTTWGSMQAWEAGAHWRQPTIRMVNSRLTLSHTLFPSKYMLEEVSEQMHMQ